VGGLPGRAPPVSPVGRRRRREGRSSQPTSHQPNATPVLGFEDLDEIGSGASGRVYRARQQRMNREVALKVLDAAPDDRDARRRFERELEITVRLGSHPHTVQVLDAGQATDGRPYLAMELFERGSAGDWLARHGPFTQADAIRAGAAIADALAAAHRAGVLHRDVKPENILLSEYGPGSLGYRVRVAELGAWRWALLGFRGACWPRDRVTTHRPVCPRSRPGKQSKRQQGGGGGPGAGASVAARTGGDVDG